MKKPIIIIILLCAFVLVGNPAYTDSLSNSKAIRIFIRVESPVVIEGSDETAPVASASKKKDEKKQTAFQPE